MVTATKCTDVKCRHIEEIWLCNKIWQYYNRYCLLHFWLVSLLNLALHFKYSNQVQTHETMILSSVNYLISYPGLDLLKWTCIVSKRVATRFTKFINTHTRNCQLQYKQRSANLTLEPTQPKTVLSEWVSEVAQSCPTLCDPVDCSLPGSSVYGILQARILEWVTISFSRGIFPTQGSNPGLPHWRQTL